ncbi:MAG TPA: sulfatase-like hydrolase/transferase [Anaerolineaceae bacterium]|nr:sulfatase-like hydrolase/transferase [Anaerolineaceae bacterium]
MSRPRTGRDHRPNILILCMDQWDTHMDVPAGVEFPAMQRLEEEGVTFDRQYCTYPVCTPSRSTMWTGVHAVHTGLWDNTNFTWINELTSELPTIGHMLREQGYYTAFKGKWHLSEVPLGEEALERYGFADYQQWGEMFGAPLQGEQLDGTVAFETIDWLVHKRSQLDQPWMLVCSLVNPHDVMFLQTDPIQEANPNGIAGGMQSTVQKLGWFEKDWNVRLPENFNDDLKHQPWGVHNFKDHVDLNYGPIPAEREDLWLKHRNYLVNCMRLVDLEFNRVLTALDRLDLWKNTIVIFTSDHGEMNAAHRLRQKGAITFDEATVVNFTVAGPGVPKGRRSKAVGSHLDLAPTLLEFAGLSEQEIRLRYPQLKGRSLKSTILNPNQVGPRGSADAPGDGVLVCWDALHALDNDWVASGALKALSNLGPASATETGSLAVQMRKGGEKYGAPDFNHRGFYRMVVDGRYKLVRWFSPLDYGNPTTLDELYAKSDVGLYDLQHDPGELANIGHPDHPHHDPALVERMLAKLHRLVQEEIGEDRAPFDLDMFGTREVRQGIRE